MSMPDKDGITGLMGRHGEWFFQKFHGKEQIRELCKEHGMEVLKFAPNVKVFAHCRKVADLPVDVVKKSIYNEFNMYYSATDRYDHGDKVWDAYCKVRGIENDGISIIPEKPDAEDPAVKSAELLSQPETLSENECFDHVPIIA
jgi:hypothetical protein